MVAGLGNQKSPHRPRQFHWPHFGFVLYVFIRFFRILRGLRSKRTLCTPLSQIEDSSHEPTDRVFRMNLLLEMLIMYAQTDKFGSAINIMKVLKYLYRQNVARKNRLHRVTDRMHRSWAQAYARAKKEKKKEKKRKGQVQLCNLLFLATHRRRGSEAMRRGGSEGRSWLD